MRRSSAAFLTCAVLILWASRESLVAADDAAPDQPPADQIETICAPDKAVVRDVVYALEAKENRLFLTSQPLEGADRQLKRDELKFTVPKDAEVVELALAKMDGKNLMAVVKVQRDGEFDFHCLTFIGPWGGGHVRDQFAFHKAKFFTTRDNLDVLAVSGKRGSVFIVLGNVGLDENDGRTIVTEGIFYSTPCPWPPSYGALSHFRVKENPREAGTD
jgi:hypothetical protein